MKKLANLLNIIAFLIILGAAGATDTDLISVGEAIIHILYAFLIMLFSFTLKRCFKPRKKHCAKLVRLKNHDDHLSAA